MQVSSTKALHSDFASTANHPSPQVRLRARKCRKDAPVGFDIKGTVEQGLDKAKEVINDTAGKEVVTDEQIAKVEEVVTDNVSKLTEKFGK